MNYFHYLLFVEYASMVITRDYGHLQTSSTRITSNLMPNQQIIDNESNSSTPVNITKNVYAIPKNL
jgi:hypothetical protein